MTSACNEWPQAGQAPSTRRAWSLSVFNGRDIVVLVLDRPCSEGYRSGGGTRVVQARRNWLGIGEQKTRPWPLSISNMIQVKAKTAEDVTLERIQVVKERYAAALYRQSRDEQSHQSL